MKARKCTLQKTGKISVEEAEDHGVEEKLEALNKSIGVIQDIGSDTSD